MTDRTTLKRAAAAKALDYVQDGMKLGLGSGSTAEIFVELLAPRVRGGEKLLCVPTSEKTAALARRLGITLSGLDDLAPLDLTVDGADEADRNLDLIKGGGGMLLREKIVAASSRRMIVIADGPWATSNGFLTPTFKLKRGVLESRYQTLVDEWRARNSPVVSATFVFSGIIRFFQTFPSRSFTSGAKIPSA